MTAMAVTTAAIGVTGIAWVLMALLGKSFAVWGAVGPVVAILGFMSFFLARPKTNAPAIIKWQVSGFVISPAGLAIVQGNVKGELKWSELKDVRYQPTRKFQVAADPTMLGIVLVLDGAKMVIVNIYDRPLRMIHERILQYWR
jgi:hypothetical protein